MPLLGMHTRTYIQTHGQMDVLSCSLILLDAVKMLPRLFVGCGVYVTSASVLSCSLAVLDPRVGHTMDVLPQLISVLCHSD